MFPLLSYVFSWRTLVADYSCKLIELLLVRLSEVTDGVNFEPVALASSALKTMFWPSSMRTMFTLEVRISEIFIKLFLL